MSGYENHSYYGNGMGGVGPHEPEEGTPEPMRYTSRGFGIWEQFEDRYGAHIRVQSSSSASERCVWIFSNEPDKEGAGGAIHLNRAQAVKLRRALEAWEKAEGSQT